MCLLAMNWRDGRPPDDFVGFAIEYKDPEGKGPFYVPNRLGFLREDGSVEPKSQGTDKAPIQMFRWVHFPRNADLTGDFSYKVSPAFMDDQNEVTLGEPQEAKLGLSAETYPGQLNVAFTRGFVSSQAFVDHFGSNGDVSTLLPSDADEGLDFQPTHPDAQRRTSGWASRRAMRFSAS